MSLTLPISQFAWIFPCRMSCRFICLPIHVYESAKTFYYPILCYLLLNLVWIQRQSFYHLDTFWESHWVVVFSQIWMVVVFILATLFCLCRADYQKISQAWQRMCQRQIELCWFSMSKDIKSIRVITIEWTYGLNISVFHACGVFAQQREKLWSWWDADFLQIERVSWRFVRTYTFERLFESILVV